MQVFEKTYFVPDTLDALTGPVSGMVTLSPMLDWTPSPTYDLSSERRVLTMYATVLREAASEEDLAVLNAGVLRAVWPRLNLPDRVRRGWESAFMELR